MEQHRIPVISTHDGFKPIQNHARALDEEDVTAIYRGGGFVALPVSGISLRPYKPHEKYRRLIDSLSCGRSCGLYRS